MSKYDYLVVGAGLTGVTIAERLASKGSSVLIVDSRDHVGGNCYDTHDEYGVLIHPYGPHIFHTSSQQAVDYLSKFTSWVDYSHRVVALVENKIIPLPFNLDSLSMCFSKEKVEQFKEALFDCYEPDECIPILEFKNNENMLLQELYSYIYKEIFEGYTVKQWGLTPKEIDPNVTKRVPVRLNYDDRYFLDDFQKMPEHGFTKMFESMLQNPLITLELETSFTDVSHGIEFEKCIYTGKIDEYFKACFGALPYRSLAFEHKHYKQNRHLPSGVLNYPSGNIPWTRITEFKQLTGQVVAGTSICVEYPIQHVPGENIPYYPVVCESNTDLYEKYLEKAKTTANKFIFAGRLGSFKYLNMDQAVLEALKIADALC